LIDDNTKTKSRKFGRTILFCGQLVTQRAAN
jgi:hypothetical protein